MVLFVVLSLLFPHKHLLLCWNLRVKDLSMCALAIALVASVCALSTKIHESEGWKLVTLGSLVIGP